ncbi:MAG: lysophospholipid acyltransferase family protein [Bacteroidia bacterium]|nr:lysophospholipid acyltransferase family protein [Bacteroidia bacterium]
MKWYYPILAFPIYLLFVLPLRVLYVLSSGLYVLLYYIVKYRRNVVAQNLKNSFPDKSAKELKQIEKEYYKHMVDVIIETLKLATISKNELHKRMRFTNAEFLNKYSNRPFLFVLGHQGNWEWSGPAFDTLNFAPLYGIYHPLSNAFFDWFMIKIRSRKGMTLVSMQQTFRKANELKDKFSILAFIADQTPMPESAYWVNFLHQETPVFVGTEKIAKRYNFPVVYVSQKKVKRGYYETTFYELTSNSSCTPDGWITAEFMKRLEHDIQNQPAYWLWSHRRWKHKRAIN